MNSNAIYAGSFDPITNGHIDVVERACRLFDVVHVGVIQNPEKEAYFSLEERIRLIQSVFSGQKNVIVEGFDGLLVDYAKQKGVRALIRGLRAVSDFDYEFQMALTNRSLFPDIDTVFLMTDAKYSYLSSSLVKQLGGLHADISSFVPTEVEKALRQSVHE